MNTYASLLSAIAGGASVTYGSLARGERMHVQSMRRDDLVVVRDSTGALIESLMGDGAVKDGWHVVATARGREVASALAPFAPYAQVDARIAQRERAATPRHAAPVEVESAGAGECGAITRKGTPCRMRTNAEGVCKAHGGPVTITRVAPALDVEVAPALDANALLAGLAALLAGAR